MKTNIAEQLQLSRTSGFRLYLQSELARRCLSNPQYSLRSFALQLGINHSTLSQLLRGKRALTPRTIETIGSRLGLPPEEIEAFVGRERQAANTAVSTGIRRLTLEAVTLLADGSHRAILELTALEEFVPDARWIARTLDLTVDEVNLALNRLTRLGLLEMAETNRWIDRSRAGSLSTDGFAQQVISRLSQQVRRLSVAATEAAPDDALDLPAARIAISASQLPVVMALIERLRREAVDLQPDEHEYQIEINLTPINSTTQTKEQ
jgi:uncharacterized protein (TIGR02147 family)